MFTVRFPSGLSVRYNDAHFLKYGGDMMDLYTKEGGTWIASIPKASGAIVEAQPACKVTAAPLPSPEDALEVVMSSLRSLPSYKVADLKRELMQFNSRSRYWK